MFSFYDFTVCIWCPEHSYDLILILTAKELASIQMKGQKEVVGT